LSHVGSDNLKTQPVLHVGPLYADSQQQEVQNFVHQDELAALYSLGCEVNSYKAGGIRKNFSFHNIAN